ncbi:hypothetical protein O6H91_07G097000 [Diphasiastrum complanatum]|nr:hypothetical protein O6H91_07G096900 [Diphasiastrum complanatum]KAJ7550362.1 hypothetical protein O6H91_07G097000 [Diphasiastrum complanatum]
MSDKLDRQSSSLAQKLRNLRGKWNSICHTQHKEFHNSMQATPILLHESASSSSKNPGGKFFDERLHPESPRCTSLDVSGASSELGRGCHKLSIATKPTWLSLQPQPTSEVLIGSAGELNISEMGRAGSLATSAVCLRDSERSISQKEDLSYSYSAEKLDQQESELTVQTDLALGRSVEQAKGSADSASTILLGGRNAFYKPLTIRNNKIATRTAEMPMFPWKDRLRSIPVSLPTDIRPSNDIADKFKHNSFPFREMKQVEGDAVKDLQTKLDAKVPWQKEAIKAIATAVLQCRSGTGKRRGINVKKDTWLLFLGSDCIGKRNMAKALAESVFGSQRKLFRISFKQEDANFPFWGDSQENNPDEIRVSNRGKTILDRIAEAVRLNPLSVVLLEDIDKADNVTRNALNRAMEKGRLQESNGREVNFSNVIVAMTASVGAENCPKHPCSMNIRFSEERLLTSLGCGMRVSFEKESGKGLFILNSNHISVVDYANLEQNSQGGVNQSAPLVACSKRKANTGIEATCDQEKKRTKENPAGRLLELDLNLPVNDEEVSASSFLASNQNLSDAVQDRAQHCLMKDFGNLFDSVVTFQSFNFDEIANNVLDLLNRTTSVVRVSRASMEIDITVIEHLVAAVWEGLCDKLGLENWAEEVLKPSISNLFQNSKVLPGMVMKLVSEKSALSKDCFTISGLPKSISIGSAGV